MSIKGFPSQQKRITGQASKADFVTVVPSADYRNLLDTAARSVYRVNSATVPRTAGAGTGNSTNNSFGTYVEDTATPALPGDLVRFENGNMAGLEIPIVEVETNGFRLAARVPDSLAPATGNSFYILRFVTQILSSSGQPSITQGPIQYVYNGSDQQVIKDPAVPANDRPLPVIAQGNRASIFDEITNLTTVAQTFTAPAKSRGFKIQALSSNTENIRMKMGLAASTTSGIRLEPGRSEDFDCAANISVIAEAGTNQQVCIQWYTED